MRYLHPYRNQDESIHNFCAMTVLRNLYYSEQQKEQSSLPAFSLGDSNPEKETRNGTGTTSPIQSFPIYCYGEPSLDSTKRCLGHNADL